MHIRRRFEKAGRTMTASNAKQADFPEGADILPNPVGTAPGFGVRLGECVALLHARRSARDEAHVRGAGRPAHPHARADDDLYQLRLRTFGLPESVVGEQLAGVEEAFPGTTIGYRAHFPEIEVKVLARGASHAAARDALRAGHRRGARAPRRPTSTARATTRSPASSGARSARRGWTLAIAESCTGGLVGHMLTREPGASDFLLLDAVTYANSAKTRILGVDEETIRWHGAVSPEVAAAMARGARRVSGADVALSLTGVAGPSGGSEAKPVGTVFIAVARADGTTDVQQRAFSGDREAHPDAGGVRRAADGSRAVCGARRRPSFGPLGLRRPAGATWRRRPSSDR